MMQADTAQSSAKCVAVQHITMAHILDLSLEIFRMILSFLQGYQFDGVAKVCKKWRQVILHNVFRGKAQRWVFSERHGCLIV